VKNGKLCSVGKYGVHICADCPAGKTTTGAPLLIRSTAWVTVAGFARKKYAAGQAAICPCPEGLLATGGDTACAKPRTTASGVALKWSYAACKPVDCGTPPKVDNSKQLASPTTFGSVRAYICLTGFEVKAQTDKAQRFGKTIKCTNTSSWEKPPVCSPVDCGSPGTAAANSQITAAATTFGATAKVICSSGYQGGGAFKCGADGKWTSHPICLAPRRCWTA